MSWFIAAGVVLLLGALSWWSSGRQRRGPDPSRLRTGRRITESQVDLRRGGGGSGD